MKVWIYKINGWIWYCCLKLKSEFLGIVSSAITNSAIVYKTYVFTAPSLSTKMPSQHTKIWRALIIEHNKRLCISIQKYPSIWFTSVTAILSGYSVRLNEVFNFTLKPTIWSGNHIVFLDPYDNVHYYDDFPVTLTHIWI